jgi:hypothetical protein
VRRNFSVFFFVIVVFSTLSLVSCNDESTLVGVDLLPSGEKSEIHYVEYGGVLGSMVSLDTMQVYATRNVGLVGILNDPVFGTTEASLLVQFVPLSAQPDFGTDPVVDSLIVIFQKTNIYGDTLQPVVFSLHRITNIDINDTTKYPVTMDAAGMYNPDFIAQATMNPDSTALSFNLGKALGTSLIAMAEDSINYADMRVFLSQFKGFYLKAEPASGLGSIYSFDLIANPTSMVKSTTRMELHYHQTDDTVALVSYFFVTDDYGSGPSIRFNVLQHDYSSTAFSGRLNDTTYNDSLLYLQGTAGFGIRLRFPIIDYWRARTDSTIAFHKVEMEIPAQTEGYDSLLYRPRYLTMYSKMQNLYSFISDHASGSSQTAWDPYFGAYSKTKTAYRYLATNHFQKCVLDTTRTSDLYLFNNAPRLTTEIFERAVISNNPAGRYIKLKVTYSLYPKK